jgi:hypothetical protein
MHYLIVAAVAWTIICRARNMTSSTPLRARLQHWAAATLAVFSLPVLADSQLLLGVALCVHLWAEARRPACNNDSIDVLLIFGSGKE